MVCRADASQQIQRTMRNRTNAFCLYLCYFIKNEQLVSWYCICSRGVCTPFTRIAQKLRFDVNAVEPNSVRQAVIVQLRNFTYTAVGRYGQAIERHWNLSAPHSLTLLFTPVPELPPVHRDRFFLGRRAPLDTYDTTVLHNQCSTSCLTTAAR